MAVKNIKKYYTSMFWNKFFHICIRTTTFNYYSMEGKEY